MGIFDIFKAKKQQPKTQPTHNIQQPLSKPIINNASAPVPKIRKQFTLDEAIAVYAETDHQSCKSEYDYKMYFSDAFETILNSLPKFKISISKDKIKRKNEIENPIDDYKNITKSSNFAKLKDFVAIDTETTGLKPGGNDIIEIAAIKFVNYRPVELFHTYLKPRKSIPVDATAVNGITDSMVADAPTFSEIKPDLQAFISDFPIIAHNASFDVKFLHVSGLDLDSHNGKVYDTLKLARNKIKDYSGDKLDDYKLATICEQLNIGCKNYHSASADTLACGLLFVDILKTVKEVDSVNDLR